MKRSPERLDAALQLLDRQVVDKDERQVCNVDDLELTEVPGGAPYVSAILAGPAALSGRFDGWLGRLLRGVHRRLHPDADPQPARIDFAKVREIGNHVTISGVWEETEPARLEVWVRDNVIAKIPGSQHAAE